MPQKPLVLKERRCTFGEALHGESIAGMFLLDREGNLSLMFTDAFLALLDPGKAREMVLALEDYLNSQVGHIQ